MTTGIGMRIAEARRAKGLSQEGLAHLTGYTLAAIQSWEKGRRHPQMEALVRLSCDLDHPVSWFFEESDRAPDHRSAA